MEADRIVGKVKDVAGQTEAAFGDATGTREAQVGGRARQASGVVQNLYGQAQDAIGDALNDAPKSAEQAVNAARDAVANGASAVESQVNARPLIAILVAALVGYVVATLMHGGTSRR